MSRTIAALAGFAGLLNLFCPTPETEAGGLRGAIIGGAVIRGTTVPIALVLQRWKQK